MWSWRRWRLRWPEAGRFWEDLACQRRRGIRPSGYPAPSMSPAGRSRLLLDVPAPGTPTA